MKKSRIAVGLVAVALVLVGAGCAKLEQATLNNRQPAVVQPERLPVNAPETSDTPRLGGDRDAHGCIGSAGYSWCPAKSKCLRSWEEECFASAEEGIRYALAAKYDRPLDEVIVKVAQEQNGFASGSVKFGATAPAGGQFLASKVGGQWLLAYDGNGSVDCEKIRQEFEFPTEMLKGFCDIK